MRRQLHQALRKNVPAENEGETTSRLISLPPHPARLAPLFLGAPASESLKRESSLFAKNHEGHTRRWRKSWGIKHQGCR